METFYLAIPKGTFFGNNVSEIKRNLFRRYLVEEKMEDVSHFNFPFKKPFFLNFKELFDNDPSIFNKEIERLYNPEIQGEELDTKTPPPNPPIRPCRGKELDTKTR